jgi:hypothetical protein
MPTKKRKKPAPKPAPKKRKKPAPKPAPKKRKKPAPKPAPKQRKKPAPKPAPKQRKKPAPKPAPKKKKRKPAPKPIPVPKKRPKRKPKPAPKKKPTPKVIKKKRITTRYLPERPKVPIYYVETGDPRGFQEDIKTTDRFMTASKANTKAPGNTINEIFYNTLSSSLQKGPFEADEIQIFRHGILVRPREGEITISVEEHIKEMLEAVPGSSIHVINEYDTFSLRINMGDIKTGGHFLDIEKEFMKRQELLAEIYTYLEEEYEKLEWFLFFDTEFALYD